MATAKADTVDTPEGRFAGLHSRWTQYSELWEPFAVAAELFLKDLWHGLRAGNLAILFRNRGARDHSFAEWYKTLGHHFSAYEDTTPVPGLVASAHGVVLELGPGTGNQLSRFAAPTITHVYGVEPNTAFADALMARLASEETPAALRDRYTPVFCGVEDRGALARQGVVPGSVDCVVSMQVLCSVERPREVAAWLYELLKPGGQVIFWEHCRSEDRVTRWVQRVWSLLWPVVVGGCRLDRPIREILLGAGEWEVVKIETDRQPHLVMPRIWGRLLKPEAKEA
ncbi:Methyltransferase-like protein 7B [Pleurostoma richardsiae]|uniref:Methyltransferase-like protein 7B n=1 Tax=Pleurostoma richardsiae TaxID=41990 RepID=A0AA38VZD9_9PEZI|nr:Methyltransferase-like protein 7B [Pleurostoma richardsiae]